MRRLTAPADEPSTSVLFQNPGSDIEPIHVSSASEALSEITDLATIITPKAEWDKMVEAIKHLMGLLNGNAPEFDCFIRGFADLYEGLSSGITNLRSSLVKHSCLVIAQAAERLGPQFELLGDYIAPLGTQLSHGTKIISDCCKFGILSISCHCYSRRIFAQIMTLSTAKGAVQRTVAAQAIYNIIDLWPSDCIGKIKLLEVIQRMLADASLEARTETRHAVRRMAVTQTKLYSELMAAVDPKTRKAIQSEGIVLPPPKVIDEGVAGRRIQSPRALTPRKLGKSFESDARNSARDVSKRAQPLAQSMRPGFFKGSPFGKAAMRPIPMKKPGQFEVVDGKEKVFMKDLLEKLEKKDDRGILGHLENVVKGVVKCGRVDPQALNVLNSLIEKFSREMADFLHDILAFLFEMIQKKDKKVVEQANEMLAKVAKSYSFDELAMALDDEITGIQVLSFYTDLIEKDDLDIGREGARKVLNLAFRCLDLDHVKAAQVMLVVDTLHHPVFASFMNKISNRESKKVRNVLMELFPEMDFPIANTNIPTFDVKDRKWMDRVEDELMKIKTAQQWLQVRSSLFKELNKALFFDEFADVVMQFLISAFEEHGTGDYELVLDGIFFNLRGKSSRTTESILTYLLKHVNFCHLLTAFSLLFESKDEVIAKNSIDFVRALMANTSKDELRPILSVLSSSLQISLQSDHPEVRQSAVLCFVELRVMFESELDPFLQDLTPAQSKLIEIYWSRRSTQE